jgi:predicted RNase H-like nuclease (RuvC/YqgF family)
MRTFLTMTEHVEGLILEIIDAKRKEAEEAQRKAEELEKKIAEQERTIKEEKEKREQLRRRQKYLQAVVRHYGWPDAADTPEAT